MSTKTKEKPENGKADIRINLDNEDINPVAGLIKHQVGASKWTLDTEKYEVKPDSFTIELDKTVARYDVFTQGGKHRAGELFYCAEKDEWFHLVPTGQKLVDDTDEIQRQGCSATRETAVKHLLSRTWPDYFEAEKNRVKK